MSVEVRDGEWTGIPTTTAGSVLGARRFPYPTGYAADVVDDAFLLRSYDDYARVEEEVNDALDQSLGPRGPEMLFDVVGELGLPAGARALDVGCGEGRHAIELARRFGFGVTGIDPVQRHVDLAARELAGLAGSAPEVAQMVEFRRGRAEDLPAESGSVDLVWCRDVLVHVDELGSAYREMRRVLRPSGWAIVYQMFVTERLEPQEAGWLLPTMGCVAANMRPGYTEAAIADAGLRIERCIVLGTEWGEYGEERSGRGGKKLLRYARLLRDADRHMQAYGRVNYEIALGDALWHIYRLIGKLSDRVYVLSADQAEG